MRRERTDVSTDNMKSVSEPPTKIINERMELDPKKVISAWAQSSEVLRDVAQAIRENQQDNDHVRAVLLKQFRASVFISVATILIHLIAVGSVLWTNLETRHYVKKVCPAIVGKR